MLKTINKRRNQKCDCCWSALWHLWPVCMEGSLFLGQGSQRGALTLGDQTTSTTSSARPLPHPSHHCILRVSWVFDASIQEPPGQISPQGKAESIGRQVWVQRPHEILASQQWLQHSGSTFACSQAYRSHAWRGLPPELLLDITHFPSWNVCIHPLLSHPVSIQLWPKHYKLTLTSYASGYDKVAPDSLLEEHRHRCWPWDENGNHKWSAGVAVLIAPFWLRENRAHSLSGTTPFSIICKIRIQFEDPPGWENCISRWSLNTYLVPGMKIPVDLAQ